MTKFSVFAGDLRQQYLNSILSENNLPATYIYSFEKADAYVVPIPFTRDNIHLNTCFKEPLSIDGFLQKLEKDDYVFSCNIPDSFGRIAKSIGVHCVDYNNCPDFILLNSYLTAEGFLSTLIETTPYTIKDINILIMGYGKCGKAIAKILKCFTENIYIYDHTPNNLENASNDGFIPCSLKKAKSLMNHFDAIVNTVPSPILDEVDLYNSNIDCIFYEIASYPFGFRTDYFEEHNRRLITCASLPGRFSPKTAGKYISKIILENMEREK